MLTDGKCLKRKQVSSWFIPPIYSNVFHRSNFIFTVKYPVLTKSESSFFYYKSMLKTTNVTSSYISICQLCLFTLFKYAQKLLEINI